MTTLLFSLPSHIEAQSLAFHSSDSTTAPAAGYSKVEYCVVSSNGNDGFCSSKNPSVFKITLEPYTFGATTSDLLSYAGGVRPLLDESLSRVVVYKGTLLATGLLQIYHSDTLIPLLSGTGKALVSGNVEHVGLTSEHFFLNTFGSSFFRFDISYLLGDFHGFIHTDLITPNFGHLCSDTNGKFAYATDEANNKLVRIQINSGLTAPAFSDSVAMPFVSSTVELYYFNFSNGVEKIFATDAANQKLMVFTISSTAPLSMSAASVFTSSTFGMWKDAKLANSVGGDLLIVSTIVTSPSSQHQMFLYDVANEQIVPSSQTTGCTNTVAFKMAFVEATSKIHTFMDNAEKCVFDFVGPSTTEATSATTEATSATTEATSSTTEATSATTAATSATTETSSTTTESTSSTTEATSSTTEATSSTTESTSSTTEATSSTTESTSSTTEATSSTTEATSSTTESTSATTEATSSTTEATSSTTEATSSTTPTPSVSSSTSTIAPPPPTSTAVATSMSSTTITTDAGVNASSGVDARNDAAAAAAAPSTVSTAVIAGAAAGGALLLLALIALCWCCCCPPACCGRRKKDKREKTKNAPMHNSVHMYPHMEPVDAGEPGGALP